MKRIITIVIVVLICLGFGYFLWKISPQQDQNLVSGYNALLDTSAAKQISAPAPFNPVSDHFTGNAKAKNVFIEYGDIQCPACKAYNDSLKQVTSVFPDTLFVFRNYPLVQLHKNTVEAALADEAAGAQGKYWEMHDLMYQKQGDWQDLKDPLDVFAQYAQQVGVADINKFKSDIINKKYLPKIISDNNEALGLSLPGTPSFVYNGHILKNDSIPNMEKEAEQWMVK